MHSQGLALRLLLPFTAAPGLLFAQLVSLHTSNCCSCTACCTAQDMLSDANPMVVANALAAMQEIQEVSGKEVLQITPHTLFKLLAALNECTEWGQVRRTDTVVQQPAAHQQFRNALRVAIQQLQDNTAHCAFQATETFPSSGHVCGCQRCDCQQT